jgi:UDP-N-acetylglucosamine 2-epimerase (non-hydrolysing)
MKTILVVVGTRPEAVKMAPVVLALAGAGGDRVRCRLAATGQHRGLLDQALAAFGLRPEIDLDLMRPGQALAGLTARAIEALDACLAETRPDLVLVQGDTTTVLAAALAAFYRRVPVGHVEAGLRTGDLQSPWPEEANRLVADRLAALHFAPTASARANLVREGIDPRNIHVTGNTGIDALFLTLARPGPTPPARRLVLVTAHRRENFGAPFASICEAVADLAMRFPDVRFVFPVHPNPNVAEPARAILARPGDPRLAAGNVRLVEPLAYPEFVATMAASALILTDSGGVQEEAPSLGVPVLVLRETTERPEAVEAGTVRLVGTDRDAIVREAARLLSDPDARAAMARAHNPYGDGHAAERIAAACLAFLGLADGPPSDP